MSIGKSAAKMIINHKRERGARMAENLTGKARGNLWAVGQTALKSRMTVQNNNGGLSLLCDYFFKMFIKSSLILLIFKLSFGSGGFGNSSEHTNHGFISVINQLDAQNFILQYVYFIPIGVMTPEAV